MLKHFTNLVLITGCQRSGTTLLGQVVGAHPNTFLIDEPDGLYEWFHAYVRGDSEAKILWESMIVKARRKYADVSKKFHHKTAIQENKFCESVTHLVLKAPNLIYSYDYLQKLEIPVKVIYPVRDPRAVVASMSRLANIPMVQNQLALIKKNDELVSEFEESLYELGDKDVPDHVKRAIVWRIKSTLQHKFKHHGIPVFSFRYEDFVEEAGSYCKRIAQYLQLEYDPVMLQHPSVFGGFGPGRTDRRRPIDLESRAIWPDRLDFSQEQEVLQVTGDEMSALGFSAISNFGASTEKRQISDEMLSAPVILCGRGGSGTRLLSALARSYDVFLGNRLNVSGDSIEWVDLIYEIAIKQVSEICTDSGWETSLKRKAKAILSQGQWKSNNLWGWKLPETMLIMPEVFRAFPRAKLIHLVRHPLSSAFRRSHMTSNLESEVGQAVLRSAYDEIGRDVALIESDEDYMRNALTWRYQVSRVAQFGRDDLAPDRYLEIRVEDVFADVESASAKFSKFLGLAKLHDLDLQIDTKRAASPDIDAEKADYVWELCRSVAEELGYSRSIPKTAAD